MPKKLKVKWVGAGTQRSLLISINVKWRGFKMKIVAEIIFAIIVLVSGSCIAQKLVSEFRLETLKKIDQGLPVIHLFTVKLLKISK